MNKTVLLIDEVGIVKIEMSNLLKSLPVEIAHVKNVIEAVNYLGINKDKVRLILWSFSSESNSDFGVVKIIKSKEKYAEIPIAVISKFTDKKNIIRALESGVNEIIAKPFENEVVVNKINKLMGNSLLGNIDGEKEDAVVYTFQDMYNKEIKAATRGNYPLTVIMASMINEEGKRNNPYEYELVNELIKLLRAKLRETDTCFYYGMNSLVAVLPFCNKEGSITVEKKIKNLFDTHALIKVKNKGLTLVYASASFPEDGKIKDKLIEKLTTDIAKRMRGEEY